MEISSQSMSILVWASISLLRRVPPGLVLLRFSSHTRPSSSALSIACFFDTSGSEMVMSQASLSLQKDEEGEEKERQRYNGFIAGTRKRHW